MTTFNTSVTASGAEEASDITSGSVTPGGENRFVFGVVLAGGPGGAADPTLMRYGGSGGTDLDQIGTDQTVTTATGNTWCKAGSPNSATTMYADWAGTPSTSVLIAAFYEDVDQTTPYNTSAANTGTLDDIDTGVASVSIPNCTIGKTVVAEVKVYASSFNLAAFTEVAGTTIRAQQRSAMPANLIGAVALEKVATATTEVLSVNVNLAAATSAAWAARGVELNDVAGGVARQSMYYKRMRA